MQQDHSRFNSSVISQNIILFHNLIPSPKNQIAFTLTVAAESLIVKKYDYHLFNDNHIENINYILLYLTEAPVVVSVSGSGAGFPSNLEAPDTASVA